MWRSGILAARSATIIHERRPSMPPTAPDNTPRYFVDYTVCGFQHTLMCRVDSTVVAADVGATIDALFTAFDSSIFATTIDDFRFADAGSGVSNPVTWPGASGYGSGAGEPANTADYYDMIGRGPTGKRVRVAIFGATITTFGGDYRISGAENALVASAIAVLTSDVQMFLDIEFNNPVWKNYINIGTNAYWRNKVR